MAESLWSPPPHYPHSGNAGLQPRLQNVKAKRRQSQADTVGVDNDTITKEKKNYHRVESKPLEHVKKEKKVLL